MFRDRLGLALSGPSAAARTGGRVLRIGGPMQTFSLRQTDGEHIKSRIIYPTVRGGYKYSVGGVNFLNSWRVKFLVLVGLV